jgi:hypothetical protein
MEELGQPNIYATMGNPMRGLAPSPRYLFPEFWKDNPLDPSVEFYYIGWDEILIDDPDVVGNDSSYNWTALQMLLDDTASRYAHAVFRIFIHFPGQPLRLPPFLSNIDMRWVQTGSKDNPRSELSPYYGDIRLLRAIQLFIKEFGSKYDGDLRIAAIQLGIIGFWGEWQTCCDNDDENVLPEYVREQVVEWYASAFTKTKLQMRYADPKSGYDKKFGRHDDSFAYRTIDGESYFFWPQTIEAGQGDFWKWGMMGGETRPELQSIIFEDWYRPDNDTHEDFMACVRTTHASYMFHHDAFLNGGYSGIELENALSAHARMGYRYRLMQVAAAAYPNDNFRVRIDVDIVQKGVAPFYYPLSLSLECATLASPQLVGGVETLIDDEQQKTFSFENVPNDPRCLSNITFGLKSPYLYDARPIRFSQGSNGIISVSIPTAPNSAASVPLVPSPTNSNDLSSLSSCSDEHKCDAGYILSAVTATGCQQYCVGETCAKLLKLVAWECGPCS